MAKQSNILSLYENFLKNFIYTFTYFPMTSWERAFSFSPVTNISFGRNVEDVEVEQHVVDEVGSYGKQLNRVLDAMTVLVARMPPGTELTPQERRYIDAFEDLARDADAASKKFKDKRRSGITLDDINHTIEDLRSLEITHPGRYRYIVERIRGELDRERAKEPSKT